jgi:predicted kinase
MFRDLPEGGIVILLGGPASGKSTFAHLAFDPADIISSDHVRTLAAADPRDAAASDRAFGILLALADERLAHGMLTVVDSTGARWDRRLSAPRHCTEARHPCHVPQRRG